MGSNVNVWISNWTPTGASPRVDQYTVDLRLEWTNDAGVPQSWSGVGTFPNDLQLVPVEWMKEALEDLILRAARKRLGVDDS